MPHRRLVKIGDTPKLPTIEEFFKVMAERQYEEIQKLKAEIAGHPSTGENFSHPVDPRTPVPDPWLLHPTRVKRTAAKKPSAKKKPAAKKSAAKGSNPKRKVAAKKSAVKKKHK